MIVPKTNADQLVNKRDDLLMFISNDPPGLITEVIPKKQVNPIVIALFDIEGYNCHLNFDPNTSNLGRSGQHDQIWVEIPTERDEKVLCG